MMCSARFVSLSAGVEVAVADAARAMSDSLLVVFPTETFYGLGVRATDETAVAALAALKARGPGKPIPLIAASRDACVHAADIPKALEPLCEAFWPGPLTVAALPRGPWPAAVSAGGLTLGIRVSSHPVATALAHAAGGIITATSANPAGAPPAAAVDQIDRSVTAAVRIVLDAGQLQGGSPSTVVAVRGDDVVILRSGAISETRIAAVLGRPALVQTATSVST